MRKGIIILGSIFLTLSVMIIFSVSVCYMIDRVIGTEMEKWFFSFLWFVSGLFIGMIILDRRSPFCILR